MINLFSRQAPGNFPPTFRSTVSFLLSSGGRSSTAGAVRQVQDTNYRGTRVEVVAGRSWSPRGAFLLVTLMWRSDPRRKSVRIGPYGKIRYPRPQFARRTPLMY